MPGTRETPEPPELLPALRRRYDCACASCGHSFQAAPSLAMREFALNTGFARCSRCGTFLHLEISPDLAGASMISVAHADHLGETLAVENSDPPDRIEVEESLP